MTSKAWSTGKSTLIVNSSKDVWRSDSNDELPAYMKDALDKLHAKIRAEKQKSLNK